MGSPVFEVSQVSSRIDCFYHFSMAFVIYIWIIMKRKQSWTEDSGTNDSQIGIPEAKHSMNLKYLVSEGQGELRLKMGSSMLGYYA